MRPKVSIVVPVYNVEKYLEECIYSIISQTLPEIEIICIDDGSTDKSGQILDHFAEIDERIKVLHYTNHGYGYSINRGMEVARGEYIGIVESDDQIQEGMYARLYEVAKQTKVDFIKADYYCSYLNCDNKKILEYCSLSEYCEHYGKILMTQPDVKLFSWEKYNWVGIYKTDFIRNNRIRLNESKGAAYQDVGFWFQVFCLSHSYYLLKEAYYEYRVDNPNSSVKNKTNIHSMPEEFDFIYMVLKEKGLIGSKYENLWWLYRIIDVENTHWRLRDESRIELYRCVRNLLLEVIEAQKISADYFVKEQNERYFRILIDSDSYGKCINRQLDMAYNKLKNYQRIVIYGAGTYGSRALDILKSVNLHNHIYCFTVSVLGKEKEKSGLPVCQIDTLLPQKENILLLVAVSPNNIQELLNRVEELNFPNYMTYEELVSS